MSSHSETLFPDTGSLAPANSKSFHIFLKHATSTSAIEEPFSANNSKQQLHHTTQHLRIT